MKSHTLKKYAIFISIFILCDFHLSNAQQNEDYQKWLDKQKQGIAEEQQRFQDFKDSRDKEFSEFLKKEWQAFELFKGLLKPDKAPKPYIIPETMPKDIPEEMIPEQPKKVQISKIHLKKQAESMATFIAKYIIKLDTLCFPFFDLQLQVNYDKSIAQVRLEYPLDEEKISEFWKDISRTKYELLLEQSQKLKKRMKLNDWGYCVLLNEISEALYVKADNKKNLFAWFMLLKAGFDAKIGYNKNDIFLLLPAKHTIYGLEYFEMDNKKYYVITFDTAHKKVNEIYTYNGNYPDAENLIALNIEISPILGEISTTKALQFKYNGQKFFINLQLMSGIINFYSNYPQTNYEIYFNASLSPKVKYSLLKELKPIIGQKSEIEAVNIILRFIQTAFKYKTDEIQFGKEKSFFAEETLFYPFSDCEDRAVLFAYLVQNLVGLNVIGLDYPGHFSTAVKFSTAINGANISYNGEKYTICDPTYINANIGICMKRYCSVKPDVILIRNTVFK